LIVKGTVFEFPPPGEGVLTWTVTVSGKAMSLGRIIVVNWLPARNIVARATPFHRIADWGAKPLPFTISVKPTSPAFALVGEIVLMCGEGLFTTPPHDGMAAATASRIKAHNRVRWFNR
jgi:hypothetical protein